MSPVHTLLLLATAHLFAAVSPGANTMLVLRTAARDRRQGFAAAAGFWPAGALWSLAGLAGVGALLHAAPWAETLLRLVCGGYLVWLGVGMLRASMRARDPEAQAAPASGHGILLAAFVTNLSNPKSIAYYTSVFAATGAMHLPLGYQALAVLGMPTIGLLWYSTLVLMVSSAAARRFLHARFHWIDRVAGTVMAGFGARLLSGC